MTFRLALAQCAHPCAFDTEYDIKQGEAQAATGASAAVEAHLESVLAMVDAWCARAAAQGAQMLVFPEFLMMPFEAPREAFLQAAQPLDGPFCKAMDALAAKYGLWLVYFVNEANPMGSAAQAGVAPQANPFNTVVLTSAQGVQQAAYRKVHLFDAGDTCESGKLAAGSQLMAPVSTPFGKVGLSICYDLRFPEVARAAALQGCQLLINPAAWVAGPQKVQQWQTLLAARAIENQMLVAGLSRPDAGCIGNSAVFGPDGTCMAKAGSGEELLLADIDLAAIDAIRARIPVFAHRKPECYGGLM